MALQLGYQVAKAVVGTIRRMSDQSRDSVRTPVRRSIMKRLRGGQLGELLDERARAMDTQREPADEG